MIWILIYEKQQINDFEKDFLSWWIMQFLEKLWKMWGNIEIFNFPQQKEEGIIKYQNQIIILQNFLKEIF